MNDDISVEVHYCFPAVVLEKLQVKWLLIYKLTSHRHTVFQSAGG
jgi:hypothetical protein